jgi:hypothetical protein
MRTPEQIFAGSLGDPIADSLLLALRAAGEAGLDGAKQHALFGRHVPASWHQGSDRHRPGGTGRTGGSREGDVMSPPLTPIRRED